MKDIAAIAETRRIAAPVPLRSALRDETRDAHAALDRAMNAFRMDEAADYRAFLQMHGALVPALEYALEAAGIEKDLPDWQRRRRRHALAADLADLDAPAGSAIADGVLPDLSDVAARLGTAYVLEGSRMGARMLLRLIPDDNRFPSRFLRHGEKERLWPRFVEHLGAAERRGLSHPAAISAARKIFSLYGQAAASLHVTQSTS